MKKFRFLFVILALILVVGMTTGLIVRKQSGGQSVMQHSSSSAPASTIPATDDPVQEQADPFEKIFLLVNHEEDQSVVVMDNGVQIDPIDTYWINGEPSVQSGAKPAQGTNYVPFDRYLVTPGSSSLTIQSSSNSQQKGGIIDDEEDERVTDVALCCIHTGSMNGDVYLYYEDTISFGVPFSIPINTFCVLVYLGEYTFVAD